MFASPFQSPFVKPFPSEAVAAAEPWYLSGGISAGQCVAAYQPKGAASLAASYSNLANPGTYDAAPGVAPTWDATSGWIFNGGQYLLAMQASAVTWSMIVRFSDFLDGGILCGAINSAVVSRSFEMSPSYSNQAVYANGGADVTFVSPGFTFGAIAIANKTGYRNGVFDGTVASGTTMPSYPIYMGALNNTGSVALPAQCNIQAVAIYDVELSAAQVLALTNAMNLL